MEDEVVNLDVPATFRHLNVVGACLRAVLERVSDVAERETVAYNVELAVHETCTNVVEHAYADIPGRIRLSMSVEKDPRRLAVDIYDTGRAFNPADVRPVDFDVVQERGYGLFLAKQLLDDVQYFPRTGGNHWRLVKNL